MEQIESFFNMDLIESIELQIYNYLTDTKMFTTTQVFHDSGITSCFVFENEVPILFEYRSKGSEISFSLPQNLGGKVSWLNLCIVYSLLSDEIFEFLPSVHIVNETKRLKWSYLSSFIGIPEKTNNNTILWLIHWPVMDYQLENGDLVSCKFATSGFNVREFGVTCVSETKIIAYDIYGPPEDRYNYHAHPAIGNKISFVVAQSPGQHIGYLNLVAILFFENNEIFDFLYRIEIVNETKDTKWIHYKRFIGIPEIKNNICWFSSWRFMGELEDGDQIELGLGQESFID
ncbi:TMV resistance protein N [Theobroma cacao]|uniref:TMV resistance protein N n=1 Tax=Theobroma cacao TaxID=3641 RepID=A0A061FW92_THECC|nr:TMV resistance protein N [Theobroma cacao]